MKIDKKEKLQKRGEPIRMKFGTNTRKGTLDDKSECQIKYDDKSGRTEELAVENNNPSQRYPTGISVLTTRNKRSLYIGYVLEWVGVNFFVKLIIRWRL